MKFHSLLLYWGSSIIFRNTSAAWNEALRPYINTGESLFFLMHTHTQIDKKEKNTATHFGELSVKTARYIYLHNLFFLDSHFSVFSAFGIWASVQFKCCFVFLLNSCGGLYSRILACDGQLPFCSPVVCTEGVYKSLITVFQLARFWDGLPVCRSAWGPAAIQWKPDVKRGRPPQIQTGICASECHLF